MRRKAATGALLVAVMATGVTEVEAQVQSWQDVQVADIRQMHEKLRVQNMSRRSNESKVSLIQEHIRKGLP